MKGKIHQCLVELDHPYGVIRVPLARWMRYGPPQGRPLLRPVVVIDGQTGQNILMSRVPFRYRNTFSVRLLIRIGLIANPWPLKAGVGIVPL